MKPFAGFTTIILTALPAQCPVLNVDYSPVYGQDADLIIGTELFHHGQSSGGAGDKPDIVLCLPLLWPRDTTCRTVLHNHFDRSIISTFAAAPSAWLFIHRIIYHESRLPLTTHFQKLKQHWTNFQISPNIKARLVLYCLELNPTFLIFGGFKFLFVTTHLIYRYPNFIDF